MNIVKSLFSGVALCLLATQLLLLNPLLGTAPFISSLSAQEAPEEHEADSHQRTAEKVSTNTAMRHLTALSSLLQQHKRRA
jgi:Na+-transporting methylmalonyl-CoA/oxaloacetate decarboxylase gamma subunit